MQVFDILTLIPGRKKKAATGWINFCAPCCSHRGHKPDKRFRGGIKQENNNFTYKCFNCHYTCGFELGKSISKNTKQLLLWLGVDETTITKWSFESLKYKDLLEYVKVKKEKLKTQFKEVNLPTRAELLDPNIFEHLKYIDYLETRGFKYNDYPFMITPKASGRNANRIIIPYTFNSKIVGYISRYLDDKFPKYIKEQQLGYVFGYDLQKPEWDSCIVVEGVLDALSISGCALTQDSISPDQINTLRSLNKKIIVVPDLDKAGMNVVDLALDLGFFVSIPNWGKEVKDTNDAVKKYGLLVTTLSILQAATNNKIKVEMARRKLGNRIH